MIVGNVAADQELALLDDADLVADVGQLGQDMAGNHDRLAHLAELLEQAADLDPRARVQAAGRLVEDQHLGVVQEHAGQAQPLRHAAGKAGDEGLALVAQVDQVEHLVADLLPPRTLDAVGRGEKLQVLDDLHVVIDAEEVGHVADDPPDFLGMRVDRVAADARLAPGRLQERGQDPHRRRLAGTVGADVAEEVALAEFQGQVLQGVQFAVDFGQVLGFDHGGGHVVSCQLCGYRPGRCDG